VGREGGGQPDVEWVGEGSGTLLKTGLLFGMNPAALNYSQILAMAPATIAWFKEAIARDHRINQALEKEWELLLIESERQRAPGSA
jgi:hypothetical protein